MRRPIAASLTVARAVLAVPVCYLTIVTAAAWGATLRPARRGTTERSSIGQTRLAVLVPAHDEEVVIGEAIASLLAVDYPSDRYTVIVVADHCTDQTVDIARRAGAIVMEHVVEPRGKGPALQWAIGRLAAASEPPEAVVVIDADSVVGPGFLAVIDAALAGGALVVQGRYGVRLAEGSVGSGLRAAALAVRHHLRPLGRTALGASSGLYGNGMAFAMSVASQHRWTGQLTEDLEMQLELLLAGVLVAYAPSARVDAEMPDSLETARSQNERWERGRIENAVRYVPRLARAAWRPATPNRLAVVDSMLDQVVPPLSVLIAATTGVAAASTVIAPRRRRGHGWGLCLQLVVHILSGLVLSGAPLSVYRSLAGAPALLVWKVRLWIRMLLRPGRVGWVRTARRGELSG